jgi:2-C-methyl-D-erythritol 4-phosphate cytidylyltransferase
MNNASIGVVFLAGGQGTRFGGEIPKQFVFLKDKPIALYSLEVFLRHFLVKEVVVVTRKEYEHLFLPTLKGSHCQYQFAQPGPRRQDSVFNGFKKLSPHHGWICTHDAARPFISTKALDSLFSVREECLAGTLGTPVTSTIKECVSQGWIARTLPRETLWEIQTPQLIERSIMQAGFDCACKKNITITDDVALAELVGKPAKVVQNSPINIKITTKEDLALAEKIIDLRQ